MRHPWVTMDGRFVLKSSRELKGGETQEMHSGMAEAQTFVLNNPRADYLHGMASLSRHERTFNEGDVIMRQGDTGGRVLFWRCVMRPALLGRVFGCLHCHMHYNA